MILVLKADSPEVYIGVWEDGIEQTAKTWEAGRELSNVILTVIEENMHNLSSSLDKLRGIIVYEGPGSYTGLRISVSTANALGFSYKIPICGASGDDWISEGLNYLKNIKEFKPIMPIYGGTVYTTKPKK